MMTAKTGTIEMYRTISRGLGDVSVIEQLQKRFNGKQTLRHLLKWVHTRLIFDKGKIDRHNDPFEIMEYGRGKCREFSILFAAACLANGHRARLILDMSDHAWVEVWIPKENRWIHVDPSEKRIDDPMMYERDWRKKLTEVYAFEDGELLNVTDQYRFSRLTHPI
jgi:hypothetical protein